MLVPGRESVADEEGDEEAAMAVAVTVVEEAAATEAAAESAAAEEARRTKAIEDAPAAKAVAEMESAASCGGGDCRCSRSRSSTCKGNAARPTGVSVSGGINAS